MAFVVPSRKESMARLMRGYARVARFARDLPYTTADRLEERAADAGDQPFILFEDQSISYAEMNARANRVAHAALASGLGKGDVVALLMLNRPEFIMVWLGLAKAGIVTALLNTTATGDILAHALRQVSATALVVGSELAHVVAAMPQDSLPGRVFEQSEIGADRSPHGWRDLNAAMQAADDTNPDLAAREGIVMSNPLYLIFTSGTTGLPKAAKMSHMRFLNAGEMMTGLMEFGAEDTMYCVLPLYHGAGGMVVPSVAMATGRPFVLRRKFSRSGFWNDVRRHHITAVYYIGEVVRYLIATPPSPDDRNHSLRVMTGAGLKPDVWVAFMTASVYATSSRGWDRPRPITALPMPTTGSDRSADYRIRRRRTSGSSNTTWNAASMFAMPPAGMSRPDPTRSARSSRRSSMGRAWAGSSKAIRPPRRPRQN